MKRLLLCGMGALLLMGAAVPTMGADEKSGPKISFKRKAIERKFRSEGVAAGDFNKDGKLDIAASDVYFAAPDWQMHVISEPPREYEPAVYSNSFCDFAEDVNGDGWDDLIVVDFPGKETWWLENPKKDGVAWKRHACVPETNNESPTFVDVDGDGKRELLFGAADRMAYAKPGADPTKAWEITPISGAKAPGTNRFSHGLGLGDVNKDGKQDVVITEGWWQAPTGDAQGEWQFHPQPFGQPCSQMHVYDFDGDGDNDVLSSSAHQTGIWWHEQTPEGWKTHEIDKSFSQTHAMCLADINGDGLMDFVTGKRWWAHGAAGDPGSDQPAVMVWFELTRDGNRPVWIPHQFDHDSGVGTQFEVVDMNADGLLDVITSNKKGTHYFEQVRE